MTLKKLCVLACVAALMVSGTQPVRAQQGAEGQTAPGKEPEVRKSAYHYVSYEGNFQVTWPAGCGKLRLRSKEPEFIDGEEGATATTIYLAICDRAERQNEGCSVTAVFDARGANGGAAGSEQVINRVQRTLQKFGVKVVRQRPIRHEFPDNLVVEGVDVMGTDATGGGEFWVRGLLSDHDIYILTAWSMDGSVWENPEFQTFFNGFVPYAE